MKHHPPPHHREICATYLYMANALHKIDHKIVQKWANAVLTPIHTVAITLTRTVVQGCSNVVRTYVQTHKHHNINVDSMAGVARGSMSVIKTVIQLTFP